MLEIQSKLQNSFTKVSRNSRKTRNPDGRQISANRILFFLAFENIKKNIFRMIHGFFTRREKSAVRMVDFASIQ